MQITKEIASCMLVLLQRASVSSCLGTGHSYDAGVKHFRARQGCWTFFQILLLNLEMSCREKEAELNSEIKMY